MVARGGLSTVRGGGGKTAMDHASSTRETTVHGGMGDIYSGRGGGIYSGRGHLQWGGDIYSSGEGISTVRGRYSWSFIVH